MLSSPKRIERFLGLFIFLFLVAARLDQAWVSGRFLGEEGSVFFAYAWHHGSLDALFRSFGGYLNLAANGLTLLSARMVQAGIVGLEHAPYVTMLGALCFQAIPAWLILFGNASWLQQRWTIFASLLILAASPATEEVFFNALHVQFHLALACSLILAFGAPANAKLKVAQALILILAPLCGPAAIVLLPFFVLRSLLDQDRARLVQAGLLGLGSAVQLLLFFEPISVRGHIPDLGTLAAMMFGRTVVMPLTNVSVSGALVQGIYEDWWAAGFAWWFAAFGFLAYFGMLTRWAVKFRCSAALWLIAPGLAVGLVSFGGGMIVTYYHDWFSVGAGERYNFIPVVLVGLGTVALAAAAQGRVRRLLVYLCILVQASGAISYWLPIKELRTGPDWHAEVARWQLDHSTPLRGWPVWWTIDLSDRSRPCSAPGEIMPKDEPLYCEQGWLEFVRNPERRPASR